MQVKVWTARKCMNCGKYHPQWQMYPVKATIAGAIIGWLCKSCFNKIRE